MSDALLSFKDVSFGYHREKPPILVDTSFELPPGRITALLGPNGAGKTTLLHLALGWLTAWKGEIRLNGRLLRQLSQYERGRWMALVPQNEHTPFDYSVLEYALMGRAPYITQMGMPSRIDYEAALTALDLVGIAELESQPVPQLSSGEHQLMLLARALTQEPQLLLLDEPTAHLDLKNKMHFIELLRGLRKKGVTLLMTNHEPEVVLAVADDVMLVEAGSPLICGPLEETLTEQTLSKLYHLPIRLREVEGKKQVIWT